MGISVNDTNDELGQNQKPISGLGVDLMVLTFIINIIGESINSIFSFIFSIRIEKLFGFGSSD